MNSVVEDNFNRLIISLENSRENVSALNAVSIDVVLKNLGASKIVLKPIDLGESQLISRKEFSQKKKLHRGYATRKFKSFFSVPISLSKDGKTALFAPQKPEQMRVKNNPTNRNFSDHPR